MESAVEALDRGVEQLFSVSARQRTSSASAAASPTSSTARAPHPLCECLALRAPPPDWRPLRRLPVLKRHVLSTWHARCEQFERGLSQRQRRQQRALDTPAAAHSAAFARRRALVAQSTRLLCVRLLQCGLLHAREVAFVQLLVAHTLTRGLGDALLVSTRRDGVRGGLSSAEPLELPLRTRLLLLREVLVQLSQPPAGVDDIVAHGDTDSTRQRLMEDVCAALQEEVLEALAKPRAAAATGRPDDRTCAFCESEALGLTGAPVLNTPARSTPWRELQDLAATIRDILEGAIGDRQRDDTAASRPASSTLSALAALRTLLTRADVATRLATRTRATVQRLLRPLYDDQQRQWRMTVSSYEQLCWRTVAAVAREAAGAVNLALWEIVWKKERQRLLPATSGAVFVHEIVVQCATADVFARTPHGRAFSPSLPGFRVVCAVLRALGATVFSAILVVHHTLAKTPPGPQRRTPALQATAATMCRAYLAQLLSSDELERERPPDESAGPFVAAGATGPAAGSALPANGEQLAGLFHALYTVFADTLCRDGAGDGPARRQTRCSHWDQLLRCYALRDARDGAVHNSAHPPIVGLPSLQGLARCCRGAVTSQFLFADDSDDGSSFRTALASYAQNIVRGVVAENGRTMTSGDGEWRELLVRSSADAVVVVECVASIAESFGPRWMSELVFQLLRCQIHYRWRARTAEISVRHQRGLNRIFFPALAAFVRVSPPPTASGTSSELAPRESEADRFFAVIAHATDLVKAACGTQEMVTAVLRFCADWDVFQLRTSASAGTSEPLERRERQWGRACFPRTNLFVDVLQVYESESVLARESSDVLEFLRDVLQSTTNCPPALESRLFQLLTRIKSRLATPSSGVGDNQKSYSESDVVGLTRVGPISHTNDALADYIWRLHTGTVSEVRDAVGRLKCDPTALDELVQHVLRWADLMHPNDSDATFGKETKLGFAVLCSRLVCWLPDESVHEIRGLLTPLDQEIVDSLAVFADSFDNDAMDVSSVRIEFLARSFVSSSVAPDLCELTDVVTQAIISSASAGARDALLKLAQRVASCLLVEVAIETLRLSLSTECLQYVERADAQALEDDDDEQQGEPSRSVNRVSNALSIVGLSSALFGRGGVSWSMSLFDEQAVRHWLLCFFDCMVYAEQSRALTPIDELLSSLEFLTTVSVDGARMAAHSYLLTALLCTASFPQSREPLALWNDLNVSVEEAARALLSELSVPDVDSETDESGESDESALLFVQTDPLRVTRATVLEAKLALASSTYLVPLDPMLNQRLRGEHQRHDGVAETARVVVRFATWLASAVIYSQSVAAALTSTAESSSSAVGHAWEQVFTDYVVYLYLPLEFGGRPVELLTAWVRVWVRISLEQANGSPGSPLLLLLPFQQKLFGRLGASVSRDTVPPESTAGDVAPWMLVFACLDQILDSADAAPEAAETAIVVLDDVVDKFELMNLATFGCALASVSMAELVTRFEAACADNRLGLLAAIERIHVLKHPLELIAFFQISGRSKSSHSLERALAALRSAAHDPEHDTERQALGSETSGAVLSEEVASFWFEWTRMLQLKYAFLAPSRCELFIHAATKALSTT